MLRKLTIAIAVTTLMAGVAYAGLAPRSGINGSKHDMNTLSGATTDDFGRTCVFCHTPHNVVVSQSDGPLWNRTDIKVPSPFVATGYTWKAPANSEILISGDPNIGPTRLCMSCHDGNIAADSHGSNHHQNGTKKLTGSAKIDTTTTHPIGFKYTDAFALRGPGELVPIKTPFLDSVPANFDTHNRGAAGTGKTIESTLYGGEMMTCASCHEVHNRTNYKTTATGTGDYNFFLHAAQEGSALCLSCHVK
jgi:hypothetical protein